MKGWVYIIVTESMPDLLKVGYSTKDPDKRAIELGNTGNPCKYEVVYEILLYEPQKVEKMAHNILKQMDLWINKEWFECSVSTARKAILCSAIYGGVFYEDVRIILRRERFKSYKIDPKWLKETLNEALQLIESERTPEHDDGSFYIDEGFLYLNS